MNELLADYIVIGSGPAGRQAAIQAAKLGKTVIVVEKGPHPGGRFAQLWNDSIKIFT